MTSADSCTFSASSQMRLPFSKRIAQVSLGTTRFFLSIHLPHLSPVIPCSYWASAWSAVLPSRKTFYVISVRQTRDLPVVSLFPHPASFRFPSRGHPCLRLYPSHCRADSGLSPVRNVRRQAHRAKRLATSTNTVFARCFSLLNCQKQEYIFRQKSIIIVYFALNQFYNIFSPFSC